MCDTPQRGSVFAEVEGMSHGATQALSVVGRVDALGSVGEAVDHGGSACELN